MAAPSSIPIFSPPLQQAPAFPPFSSSPSHQHSPTIPIEVIARIFSSVHENAQSLTPQSSSSSSSTQQKYYVECSGQMTKEGNIFLNQQRVKDRVIFFVAKTCLQTNEMHLTVTIENRATDSLLNLIGLKLRQRFPSLLSQFAELTSVLCLQ